MQVSTNVKGWGLGNPDTAFTAVVSTNSTGLLAPTVKGHFMLSIYHVVICFSPLYAPQLTVLKKSLKVGFGL